MPFFDFGSLLGGLFGGIFNLGASIDTNKTNEQIAEQNLEATREANRLNYQSTMQTNMMNYKMNKENNQTQIDLANQAYERSTQSNQVKELMKAGLTYQQALHVVAGSGSPASMPMPTTTAVVAEAPQVVPETKDFQYQSPLTAAASDFGSALGAVGGMMNQYVQDCQSEFGGFTGQRNIMPLKRLVQQLTADGVLNLEDLYGLSPSEFRKKLSGATSGSETDTDENGNPTMTVFRSRAVAEFFNSADWHKCMYDLPTMKAFEHYVRGLTSDGSVQQDYKQKYQNALIASFRAKQEQLSAYLANAEFTALGTNEQSLVDMFSYKYNNELLDAGLRMNTLFEQFCASQSQEYKDNVYKAFLADSEALKFTAMLNQAKQQGMFDAIDNDFMRGLYGYFNMAQECGFLDMVERAAGSLFDLVGGRFVKMADKGIDILYDKLFPQNRHHTTSTVSTHTDSKGRTTMTTSKTVTD